ncbi:MAG: MazG nucleotide pyrophosphohydrolase domain-containing protein [Dysosmobacter sp.]
MGGSSHHHAPAACPEGCPWDREQTHQSIRRNFLEETYEALDAIDRNDTPGMCEELGDVLLQVVFHSVMEEEQGRFTADDVVDGVAQKLVFRHPSCIRRCRGRRQRTGAGGLGGSEKKGKGVHLPGGRCGSRTPYAAGAVAGGKDRLPLRKGRLQLGLRCRCAGQAG